MKVAKPTKLPILTRVSEFQRRCYFHVAAMLGFPIQSPRALVDELMFWKVVGSTLGEQGVIDEGFSKARGELLVAGSFHAPGGAPLTASYVRVKLGAIDKRLAVVGDRVWRNNASSAPEPMTTMPIDWAHAFGGPKYDRNPYGKGADPIEVDGRPVQPLPNVDRYGALLRSPSDDPEPAGFRPMDVTFAQRRKRAGTFDKRWFEEHFPGTPPDADPTFVNVAPEDQWIDGFFRGDEEFVVENMHPDKPRLEGRLPGLVARCFVTQRGQEGDRFLEIPMRCDTVWLFPNAEFAAIVLHGSIPVASDDAADIVHLVCACEDPATPRTIEHYQHALARRLDKDKGAIAMLADGDLMPQRESGVAPNVGEMDIGRWIRGEDLEAKNMRRGQARTFAENRARVIADGHDPKDFGLDALPPVPEAPPLDDLDALAVFMEAESERLDAMMADAEATAAAARAQAMQNFADMGQDYDALAAQAAKDEAGPPKFTAAAHFERLGAMAAESRAGGVVNQELEERLADPRYHAQVERQEQGLREMYRTFAHHQPGASAMAPESSAQARILVELAVDTGEALSHRDLTGANLAGLRMIGVDLSGSFLEAADLSGCDLSGANLEGAVLTRANLRGASLSGARVGGANLGGAVLSDAVLDGADLTGAVLSKAELTGARFTGAVLTGADWFEAKLAGVDLSGAVLGQCNLMKGDLRGARFVGADLTDANMIECALDGADFTRAIMQKTTFLACTGAGVSFRQARLRQGIFVHGSSFPGADFSDADMEKANLRGTVLTGARFDRANLAGSDLSDCDATGASFERAVIKGGMLIRTKLVDAKLQGANLMDTLASKSRLAGADFTGANLYRADLSRVVGDTRTTFTDAEVGHVRFLPKADAKGAP